MKIRWTRGSVRFRISPGELAALQQGAAVTETLLAPGGAWSAVISVGDGPTEIGFEGGQLRLTLGAGDRDRLTDGDAEGVYFHADGPPPLRFFIEKDFPCAHPGPAQAQEPPSETFAPPPNFRERHRGD